MHQGWKVAVIIMAISNSAACFHRPLISRSVGGTSACAFGGYALSRLHKEECTLANTQESRPSLRWASVCIDCADADQMAEFYSRLLGWEIAARDTPATRQGGTGWVARAIPQEASDCRSRRRSGISLLSGLRSLVPKPRCSTLILRLMISTRLSRMWSRQGEQSHHTNPRTGCTTCG